MHNFGGTATNAALKMPDKSGKKLDVPLPMRVTTAMHEETIYAAKRRNREYMDTHREATEIGLKLLRLIDYDVAGSVTEMALRLIAERAKKGKE